LIATVIAVILFITFDLIFIKNESSLGIKVLPYARILIACFVA
jgi:hypothetical protein